MAEFDSRQAAGYQRVSGYLKRWAEAAVRSQKSTAITVGTLSGVVSPEDANFMLHVG